MNQTTAISRLEKMVAEDPDPTARLGAAEILLGYAERRTAERIRAMLADPDLPDSDSLERIREICDEIDPPKAAA